MCALLGTHVVYNKFLNLSAEFLLLEGSDEKLRVYCQGRQ